MDVILHWSASKNVDPETGTARPGKSDDVLRSVIAVIMELKKVAALHEATDDPEACRVFVCDEQLQAFQRHELWEDSPDEDDDDRLAEFETLFTLHRGNTANAGRIKVVLRYNANQTYFGEVQLQR